MLTELKNVGFEIEGEFSEDLQQRLQNLGEMKGDGSVKNCPSTSVYHKKHGTLSTGEFASNVYCLTYPKASRRKLEEFFDMLQKKSEAGEYHWNKSAGFHIHTSYSPQRPPEIYSKEFYDQFLAALANTFPTAFEARKNSHFCEAKQTEDEIGGLDSVDRYNAVNYHAAMDRHGTIEFRIFPSAEPKTMKEFLFFTIKFIQDFLKKCAETGLKREYESTFKQSKRRQFKSYNSKVEATPLTSEDIIFNPERNTILAKKTIIYTDMDVALIPDKDLKRGVGLLGISGGRDEFNSIKTVSYFNYLPLLTANALLPALPKSYGTHPISGEYLPNCNVSRKTAYIKDQVAQGFLIEAPDNLFKSE